nr:MAG TPA: hypothetical protein [Bacteriophage sp.]
MVVPVEIVQMVGLLKLIGFIAVAVEQELN